MASALITTYFSVVSLELTFVRVKCFVYKMLAGRCPTDAIPFFFGGRVLALNEKSGGIRPIVVGMTSPRLTSKCASSHCTAQMAPFPAHASLLLVSLADVKLQSTQTPDTCKLWSLTTSWSNLTSLMRLTACIDLRCC